MSERLTTSENVLMIEEYLNENYELRYNVLSKKIEVRMRKENEEFVPLCDKKLNSIVRRVKLEIDGVKNVKQNVHEYVDSEDIEQYDPVCDWLRALPAWDGRNRVTELFSRIPGITSEQIYWCSIWMRSAVAHWLGLDPMHANESIPTLIGEQGCGKSTFCRRLLPPHLSEYFLDHINLGNKFDKEMALTNNLLVNLDELDQIRPAQQPEIKQTVSKVKVNGRQIYGRNQQDRKRYASFVSTTNNPHPLQDPTGSRRYLCISIPKGMIIDNDEEIEYEQLYAQVMEEVVVKKCRYWFNNDETRQIQQVNSQFQQEQDLCTMLETCFRHADDGEVVKMMPVKTIIAILEKQYPLIKKSHSFTIQIGLKLKNLGFNQKYIHGVSCYDTISVVSS